MENGRKHTPCRDRPSVQGRTPTLRCMNGTEGVGGGHCMENKNRKLGQGEFAKGPLDSTFGLVLLNHDVLIHGESNWVAWGKYY